MALGSRAMASPESQKTVILEVILSSIRFSTNREVAFRRRGIQEPQERGVTDLQPSLIAGMADLPANFPSSEGV